MNALESLAARHWWRPRPSVLSRLLWPLSQVYRALRAWRTRAPLALPVPVVVVGNVVVGGAGKTPTVIALVQALAEAGRRPGVVSRGYGRTDDAPRGVHATSDVAAVGDEPLLIHRRTGVPVWVGRDRHATAGALLLVHPDVDVIVSDDGLQHGRLPRASEVVVFDERGAGNGWLLPAGPLREPVPATLPARRQVLYTGGHPTTALPGGVARRALSRAWPLAAWHAGDASRAVPLEALRGRPLAAAAGIAAPGKFFAMLEAAGLSITPHALADHDAWRDLPWPEGTPAAVVTEKDAVKLDPARLAGMDVWVVPLDFQLPDALLERVLLDIRR